MVLQEPAVDVEIHPTGIVAASPPPPSSSCWGRCGRSLRLLIPTGAWQEARELIKIGAPVVGKRESDGDGAGGRKKKTDRQTDAPRPQNKSLR